MNILKNIFGKNDTKIHVDEIVNRSGSLLGGLVMESSELKDTHRCLKFADGTMIVIYIRPEIDITDILPGGTGVVHLGNPWEFVDVPAVVFDGFYTDNDGVSLYPSVRRMQPTGTVGNQYLSIRISNTTEKTITRIMAFNAIAIGRWK